MTTDKEKEFHAAMGWRLKVLRQSRGMSQEHLGELVRVTYQTIQKHEEGMVRIPPRRLDDFARIFAVPVGYFFGEDEHEGQRRYDRTALIIAAEVNKLPSDKVKKSAYQFIKTINDELASKSDQEEAA